jgi:hypothetical protein
LSSPSCFLRPLYVQLYNTVSIFSLRRSPRRTVAFNVEGGVTSRDTFLFVSSGHDDPKAARLTPCGTAPRRPSSLVSGLRSENASPPRSAPAGPGDHARRATNQTCGHVALDVQRSLPRWKEDGRRVLWKASRGLGASFSSVVVLSLPLYRVTTVPSSRAGSRSDTTFRRNFAELSRLASDLIGRRAS